MAEDSMRPHAVARQWPQNDHSGQIRPMATMSALLRKADIPQRRFNVSFGPIADIGKLRSPRPWQSIQESVRLCGGVWLPRNERLLLRTHAGSARHPTDAPQAS